jgi:DNA repair photolyase
MTDRTAPPKGRGTVLAPDSRHLAWTREAADDGWWPPEEESPRTTLIVDTAKTVISRNDSPDLPFDRSVNTYRGCEHGCIYCYARPSHAWLGLSPGLDFETRIAHKPDAAARLRAELAKPGYACAPIMLGSNTDAWQPVERRLGLTRAVLEVLAATRHPVCAVTKSAGVLRDVDLLADLARDGLARVAVSVTTLDADMARRLEPRAASPKRRLEVIAGLAQAGIPAGVLFAPVIPAINDHELERVLEAAAAAGASYAAFSVLRLPQELVGLFEDWLARHLPDRATHVLSLVRQLRGGALDDSRFGTRMGGQGPLAGLLEQRFRLACKRLGFGAMPDLDASRFRSPRQADPQLDLF